MIKDVRYPHGDVVVSQGVDALIAAIIEFLGANNVSKRAIRDSMRRYCDLKPKSAFRQYRRLARAYEEMGIVMSTWFSSRKFVDKDCQPLPLTIERGAKSVQALVCAARVSISATVAIELMRRSPSIGIDRRGNFLALRREFVLPDFAVPRAALVIERYLDTLHKNSSKNGRHAILLLERNCHVPEVNLKTIAPILRDIKRRGSAFIDSVNGDIEGLRSKRLTHKGSGEMSVHIFAWTRLSNSTKYKRSN